MKKLLQTIKKNNKDLDEWIAYKYPVKFIEQTKELDEIKSYITQSRISELEALEEMIKKRKRITEISIFPDEQDWYETDEDKYYNQALNDIAQILQTTINQYKEIPYNRISTNIKKSRITELEALIEMVEKEKENGYHDYTLGRNAGLDAAIRILKKQLNN